MPTTVRLLAAMAATVLGAACSRASSPVAWEEIAAREEAFAHLEARQQGWCEKIAGRSCGVGVSAAHPEYAAWVEWSTRPPAVMWNDRVLSDRQFWATDPRMAHEACHLKHGLQPSWSSEQKEDYANRCAIEHTGAPS